MFSVDDPVNLKRSQVVLEKPDLKTTYDRLTEIEVEEEVKVLSLCSRSEFYQLLKNEPMKYLSLLESVNECFQRATDEFGLTLHRNNEKELVVNCSVKGEHPVIFTDPSDYEVAEDLQLYVNAKLKEKSAEEMGMRLPPKRKQPPHKETSSSAKVPTLPTKPKPNINSSLEEKLEEISSRLGNIERVLIQIVASR